MTTETAVSVTNEDREYKRQSALLKAIGLDRVPPEQREIALAIAKRYDLDLLLKHLVLVDGRPYITRDGLLHIAHRSGVFDGMEVSDPTLTKVEGQGDFWTAHASVYRKDMSRPFTYHGRYPSKGGNQRYAPEMAVKVAESMALRRAFDVSAPSVDERWDVADNAPPMEAVAPLSERIAATRAAIEAVPPPEPVASEETADHLAQAAAPLVDAPTGGRRARSTAAPRAMAASPAEEEAEEVAARPLALCGAMPPEDDPLGLTEGGPCRLAGEHRVHRNSAGSWPA